MAQQYAKDNGQSLSYPTDEEFAGIVNWRSNDKVLRLKGYKPLEGTAQHQEGKEAQPKTWHVVSQSTTVTEQRQVKENGSYVMKPVPVTVDTSYIQIDTWKYIDIPEEHEDEQPVHYSKYRIQLACQKRGLWDQVKAAIDTAGLSDSWNNIIDLSSDNPELLAALPAIRQAFGADTVDAVLAESVALYSQLS